MARRKRCFHQIGPRRKRVEGLTEGCVCRGLRRLAEPFVRVGGKPDDRAPVVFVVGGAVRDPLADRILSWIVPPRERFVDDDDVGRSKIVFASERSPAQEPDAGCVEVPFADGGEHRQVEFSWRRRRAPLDPHAPRHGRRPHRRLHRHGHTANAWSRSQPLEHLVVESDPRFGIAVLRARQAHVDRDEIAGIESRIQRRETHEAGEKQAGGNEQHLRNRQLARHKQQLRAPVSSGGCASHARLNRRAQRRARCAPRRPANRTPV